MQASVSVVIPAYNSAYCLGRCIESVLSQTQPPSEIVVVNDGSEDATGDIARGFGSRIIYLEQENRGQGAARNAGLRIATGEYIAFLDADDFWAPEFVSTCTGFLREHSDAVAVNTAYMIHEHRKTRVGPSGLLGSTSDHNGYILANFFDTWAHHDHVRTGTVMIRHETIEQAGHQLEIRISQDLEYWGYIATFGPWGFVPAPLWQADSARRGGPRGWLKKNRTRRLLCPTVDEWQSRIRPRLSESDWPGFRVVRGRVAKSFAHAKILARDFGGAGAVVEKWGEQFPQDRIGRILRRWVGTGEPWWGICCRCLVLREFCKNVMLSTATRRRGVSI